MKTTILIAALMFSACSSSSSTPLTPDSDPGVILFPCPAAAMAESYGLPAAMFCDNGCRQGFTAIKPCAYALPDGTLKTCDHRSGIGDVLLPTCCIKEGNNLVTKLCQ
jgi:hypothetical protein